MAPVGTRESPRTIAKKQDKLSCILEQRDNVSNR